MILKGTARAAKSGRADAIVILLHGYGADGNDLIGLADPLAPHLPNVAFRAPNAPERCVNNPMGYQWFPIPWLDGSSEATARASRDVSIGMLNAYLDETIAETGIPAARMILVGFSQGTMMSLHVGPRRAELLAGIVGFSGRLLEPELLKTEIVTYPPVLLIHGDQDEMIPVSELPLAANGLTAAGIETYTHVSPGTGHGIAPDGLGLALQFIRKQLTQGDRPVS